MSPLSFSTFRPSPSISITRSILAFFFFNDTATTEIYTLSLHDALPICAEQPVRRHPGLGAQGGETRGSVRVRESRRPERSEEHTSELQSRPHLVCRLLLEKKKTSNQIHTFLSLCTYMMDVRSTTYVMRR